jgi:hypothetical protein
MTHATYGTRYNVAAFHLVLRLRRAILDIHTLKAVLQYACFLNLMKHTIYNFFRDVFSRG